MGLSLLTFPFFSSSSVPAAAWYPPSRARALPRFTAAHLHPHEELKVSPGTRRQGSQEIPLRRREPCTPDTCRGPPSQHAPVPQAGQLPITQLDFYIFLLFFLRKKYE